MGLLSSGDTNIGMKRKTNQDSVYLNPKKNIFVVADGMGGHNGGDIASDMAVKCVPQFIMDNYTSDPIEITKSAIIFANDSIKKRGEKDQDLVGMGTTVTSFLFKGPTLYVGNVGDSRAYLISNGLLFQMSRDHSLVHEKLNLGLYDRDQAASDPHKNVLVRTVGFESDIDVDVFTYKVHRNDIFLTCSDGLHGLVSDRDILHMVNTEIPDPSKATQAQADALVNKLINQANANGGNDNITVIIVIAQ